MHVQDLSNADNNETLNRSGLSHALKSGHHTPKRKVKVRKVRRSSMESVSAVVHQNGES